MFSFTSAWQEVGTHLAGELDQEQSKNQPQRDWKVVDKNVLIKSYRADVCFYDQLGVRRLFDAKKRGGNIMTDDRCQSSTG